MTILFRARHSLFQKVREDLARPHAFAAERVGFLFCRAGKLVKKGLIILAAAYQAVADEDYIRDSTVGAMMGPAAIRKALQHAYNGGGQDLSIFHIHMHDHNGRPGFSGTDIRESKKFVPDFFNAVPSMPHGAIVLSRDEAMALCWWGDKKRMFAVARINSVGAPLRMWE